MKCNWSTVFQISHQYHKIQTGPLYPQSPECRGTARGTPPGRATLRGAWCPGSPPRILCPSPPRWAKSPSWEQKSKRARNIRRRKRRPQCGRRARNPSARSLPGGDEKGSRRLRRAAAEGNRGGALHAHELLAGGVVEAGRAVSRDVGEAFEPWRHGDGGGDEAES